MQQRRRRPFPRWSTAQRHFADDEALVDEDTGGVLPSSQDGFTKRRALMASGVDRGDRVAIWAPNISEWVVAALAVHSVGVAGSGQHRFKGRSA
jgi:acyl-CoA synthetase (AMP-forming)/AMP-acid ligase II